jgi:dUTP pyrophosphatase
MSDISVKVKKIRPNAILPEYQTIQAAGMDAHACIENPIILKPMERQLIPTGIAIELPVGFELQIRARSSLGLKHGITMVNGVGTVDSDYRGEIGVALINLGQDSFTVEPDMRIAQMIIARHEHATWNEVDTLDETQRGTGGFGSTGTGVNN